MSATGYTDSEYRRAKLIVIAYEDELERKHKIRVEAFRKELEQYFAENLIDGRIRLKSFKLEDGNIIPTEPYLEENYEGGNNEAIEAMCQKHGVHFKMIYWCYHK